MYTYTYITILDWLVSALLVPIIYWIAIGLRNKWYPEGHPWRAYFIPALTVKIIGSVFIGLLYMYYYGGGDTYEYHRQAQVINHSFFDSPAKWIKLILHTANWYDGDTYDYISKMPFYQTTANYYVCSIAALLGLIVGSFYLPTAILFAVFSFTGIWALFRTFSHIYPSYTKQLSVAILFFPSVVLWGSGLLKDSICMLGLGWLTYGAFQMLINGNFSLKNILWTFFCAYLVFIIKIYILAAFFPALIFWILATYVGKIQNPVVRLALNVSVPVLAAFIFILIANSFKEALGGYSLDSVLKSSQILRTELYKTSLESDGSAYNLGEIDPHFPGIFLKAPAAINVTLYRPYVWEVRNPIMLLSALESLTLAIITIYIFAKNGIKNVFSIISKNPDLQFFILFTLIFAFATGISTYNFGSLSRYKIPCMPFIGMTLMILWDHANQTKLDIIKKRQSTDNSTNSISFT
jgi:hypothetical protein